MAFRQAWYKLVRFGFYLLYNQMAWAYDAVSWLVSLGAWRAWQQAALPFVRGQRVLEIGHGTGHLLKKLESAVSHPIGLDLSPYMGRIAQKHTQAPLIRAQVQQLPFASGAFDTVLSTFPTDYIVDPATLAEVRRVLAKNGRFLIVPEGHLTGHGFIHRFIDGLFRLTGQRSHQLTANLEQQLEEQVWQPFKVRFEAVGFVAQIHPISLPGSEVTVVCLERA